MPRGCGATVGRTEYLSAVVEGMDNVQGVVGRPFMHGAGIVAQRTERGRGSLELYLKAAATQRRRHASEQGDPETGALHLPYYSAA